MKINPNQIKTRDWAMVQIIQGVTKAGVQTDKRKARNKKACRKGNWNKDD
jgi:hypothetical protein